MSAAAVVELNPALVVLQTVTCALTFIVTRRPQATVEHLGCSLEVWHQEAFHTAHAERIAAELRWQFRDQAIATWGRRLWFTISMDEALAAVGEFDLASGERHRLGDVEVGQVVEVALGSAARALERAAGTRGAGLLARGRLAVVRASRGSRFLLQLGDPVGDVPGLWVVRSGTRPT